MLKFFEANNINVIQKQLPIEQKLHYTITKMHKKETKKQTNVTPTIRW